MTDQDKAVIKETVVTTLTMLGIDVTDPLEVQADMLFLNKARKMYSTVFTKVILVVITAITLGAVGVLGAAIIK